MLIPKLLPIPFAENGRKNTIPDNRTSEMKAHLASFDTGFPAITMLPKQDGGLPPDGMDMNGILYDLSVHAVYQNKGGQYKFDTEYAELIGGYPKGAILLSDDEAKQYISVAENNKDNFNDESSAKWKVISLSDIDVLLNDKVSSQTMADALNLKLDKTTYATLTQKGITQLTNTIDNSEDKAVTPKTVNTVKKKADQVPNPVVDQFLVGDNTTSYKLLTVDQVKTLLNITDEIPVPVDQIFYFDSSTPPQGYIARNGQAINKISMPKLYARYGENMPDDRDRVHRMTGTLAGAVGTTQEDAIRNITGVFYSEVNIYSASGAFSSEQSGARYGIDVRNSNGKVTFDASRVVPTAEENRVKSRIIIACNKIQ